MKEEQLWALSPIKVVPRKKDQELLEVLKVCKTSGLVDTSALKLKAILSGEDYEWRVYAKKSLGAGRVHLDLIKKVETRKMIKHGGMVVNSAYSRAEMDIKVAANDVIWKTVFSESEVERKQPSWQSMRMPRAAVGATA